MLLHCSLDQNSLNMMMIILKMVLHHQLVLEGEFERCSLGIVGLEYRFVRLDINPFETYIVVVVVVARNSEFLNFLGSENPAEQVR